MTTRPRPSSSSSKPGARLASLGVVLSLILAGVFVLGAAWSCVNHVTWNNLSAGPDAPDFHSHLQHLRGPYPWVLLQDALNDGQPSPCHNAQQTPAPLQTLSRMRGCTLEADNLAQRHPHYTIERVAYTTDRKAWVMRLVPRRGDIPLRPQSLALFGLPDVPLTHEVVPDAHKLEWDGTASSVCAQADSTPCTPSLIRVYGTDTEPHRVTMVKLLFVRAHAIGGGGHDPGTSLAQAPTAQLDPSRATLGVERGATDLGTPWSKPAHEAPRWSDGLTLKADLPRTAARYTWAV